MRKLSTLVVFLGALGCYHATVETGATPSTQKVSKEFASGWVYGLVPPSTVETAAQCPNGAARVETKVSFVNGLVGILTLYIYTPMTIEVTCAASSSAGTGDTPVIRAGTTPDGHQTALDNAVRTSKARGGAPVIVVF